MRCSFYLQEYNPLAIDIEFVETKVNVRVNLTVQPSL